MQDKDNDVRLGKEVWLSYEEYFAAKMTAFRGARVQHVMMSGDAGVAAAE